MSNSGPGLRISGALEKAEYEALLSAVGFVDVSTESIYTYPAELLLGSLDPESAQVLHSIRIASTFVWARKPAE